MHDRLWDVFDEDLEAEDAAGARERIRRRREEDGLPVDDETLDRLVRGEGRTHELEWLTDDELARRLEAHARREALAARVQAYVRAHAKAAFGGLWLTEPDRVHVAFAHDAERHEGALRAILGEASRAALHVERVARTEAELKRVMQRLDDDAAALEAAGVRLSGYGIYVRENVAVVDAVVDDPEAATRLLEERYGGAVRLGAAATPAELVEAQAWQLWSEPEPARLVVHYVANTAYAFERVEVDESPEEVRVTLYERAPGMVVTLVATTRSATAELREPVGDRAVVDGATGRRRGRAD